MGGHFFHDSLQCNDLLQCKTVLLGKFDFFEYLSVQIKGSTQDILVNVYRPPKPNANFFNDFKDLLSVISVDYDCLII